MTKKFENGNKNFGGLLNRGKNIWSPKKNTTLDAKDEWRIECKKKLYMLEPGKNNGSNVEDESGG